MSMAGWGVTVYVPDAEAGEGSSSSTKMGDCIVTPLAKKAKKAPVEVFAIYVYHNAEPSAQPSALARGRWQTLRHMVTDHGESPFDSTSGGD